MEDKIKRCVLYFCEGDWYLSMKVLQGTNQAMVKNHIFISRETELSISAPDLVGFQLG